MFTGIIPHQAVLMPGPNAYRWHIVLPEGLRPCLGQSPWRLGDSVAVDGICLTVSAVTEWGFWVDIAETTCHLTTAQAWTGGRRVHIEPALRAGDPLGGHCVTGHVDDLACLQKVELQAHSWILFWQVKSSWLPYLAPRGSVTLDGVSLTIRHTDAAAACFSVAIIPHTAQHTHLVQLEPGAWANLEIDPVARYVLHGLSIWRDIPDITVPCKP